MQPLSWCPLGFSSVAPSITQACHASVFGWSEPAAAYSWFLRYSQRSPSKANPPGNVLSAENGSIQFHCEVEFTEGAAGRAYDRVRVHTVARVFPGKVEQLQRGLCTGILRGRLLSKAARLVVAAFDTDS